MRTRTRKQAPATAAVRTARQDTDPTTTRSSPELPPPGAQPGRQAIGPQGARTPCRALHERARGKLRRDVGGCRILPPPHAGCRAHGAGLAAMHPAPDSNPPPGPRRWRPRRRPAACRQPRRFSARPAIRRYSRALGIGSGSVDSGDRRTMAHVATSQPEHAISAPHPAPVFRRRVHDDVQVVRQLLRNNGDCWLLPSYCPAATRSGSRRHHFHLTPTRAAHISLTCCNATMTWWASTTLGPSLAYACRAARDPAWKADLQTIGPSSSHLPGLALRSSVNV